MVYIKTCYQRRSTKKFYELAHGFRAEEQKVRHHFLSYLGPPYYDLNQKLADLSRQLSRKAPKNLKDWEVRVELQKVSTILKIIKEDLGLPAWWIPYYRWMERRLTELEGAARRLPSLLF